MIPTMALSKPSTGATVDSRPMRILVTTPLMSRPGGVSQYLRVVRPHMQNDVQYFTIGKRDEDERADRSFMRILQDAWLFATTLKGSDFEIVHLNPSFSSKALIRDGVLLLISKGFGKSVVVFMHGWNHSFERFLSQHLSWLFRFVYGRADAFIVLSNEFQRKLKSLGYDKAVFVQGAPVEDDLLDESRRQPALRPASGRRTKFNILFLARVEKEKGIYEALETYRRLKEKYSFVSLTVAGDGCELTGAVRYACDQRLSDVSFSGYVEGSAKYELLQAADAYLFPSYTEGLPLSVLEAMAYGLPVVTRAVGGLRDFFEDVVMGYMTESHDPEVFTSLLSRLIDDSTLCSKISLFNREYARNQFAARRVAAGLEEVYRSVLGSSDPELLYAR